MKPKKKNPGAALLVVEAQEKLQSCKVTTKRTRCSELSMAYRAMVRVHMNPFLLSPAEGVAGQVAARHV